MDYMDQSFINWAEKQLGENVVVTREPHGDQSTVYYFATPKGNYYLKIGHGLEKERGRLEWAIKILPVPKILGFTHIEDRGALLLSAIEGTNLAKLCKEWPAEKIVDKLADALRRFNKADIKNCPFGSAGPDKVLVHGDACLPNFIFNGDELAGYIDLGDMRIDDVEVDLSAAVWSLQYNLGPGYGLSFLKKYGIRDATEKLVEKLRLRYEEMQKEWGLL
jgi:aminoglycoside phosphotransferase